MTPLINKPEFFSLHRPNCLTLHRPETPRALLTLWPLCSVIPCLSFRWLLWCLSWSPFRPPSGIPLRSSSAAPVTRFGLKLLLNRICMCTALSKKSPLECLCPFVLVILAALTRYHQLGGLSNRLFCLTQSLRLWSPRSGPASEEGPPSGLSMAAFS